MKHPSISEFELIRWIRSVTPATRDVPLGIGDDSAEILLRSKRCLVTCDQLVENIHFTLDTATPTQIGHKAMARALSDIAAMAGIPKFAVVSILFCQRTKPRRARLIYRGMKKAADAVGTTIVGGDIAARGKALVINVTIIGVPGPAGTITRSGARPGDVIFVTGKIGGSIPGKHLRFQPRIREALELARKGPIHAMIDISDGLAADLQHILEESCVGAVLSAKDIPISHGRPTTDRRRPKVVVHRPSSIIGDRSCEIRRALAQGEDYELLFVVPPRAADAVPTKVCGVRVSRIGHIIAKRKMMLDTGGELRVIKPGGWVHKLG